MKKILENKILNKKAIIGIIGLGYVGIPLTKRFVDEGFSVIGFDSDKRKINLLKKFQSYIKHIPSEVIKSLFIKNRFNAFSNFKKIPEVDIIIICVPTPLKKIKYLI